MAWMAAKLVSSKRETRYWKHYEYIISKEDDEY